MRQVLPALSFLLWNCALTAQEEETTKAQNTVPGIALRKSHQELTFAELSSIQVFSPLLATSFLLTL